MTEAAIEFDVAMHTKCQHCLEPAMKHRMTDTGNFYCLEPKDAWNSRYMDKAYQHRWATSRAPVRELRKSPLSAMKEIGQTLVDNLRVTPSVSQIADTLL